MMSSYTYKIRLIDVIFMWSGKAIIFIEYNRSDVWKHASVCFSQDLRYGNGHLVKSRYSSVR